MDHRDEESNNRPTRRKRYRGSHPRSFEERYKELAADKYPQIAAHVRAQGRTPAGAHVPVLGDTLLSLLRPASPELVLDCTLGHGGHALAFLRRLKPAGRLIGLDVDPVELERTQRRIAQAAANEPLAAFVAYHSNYAGAPAILAAEGISAVDILLADLGVSSMQLDDPARGFSYKNDGPLDMRMNPRAARSAADWLRNISPERLAQALSDYGDLPRAAELAEAIVQRRRQQPLLRTRDLVQCVERAGIVEESELARLFQALRILVNDELGALRELLRVAPALLRPVGRCAIISFHSGEDRLVKRAFRAGCDAGVFATATDAPIRAPSAEVAANARAAPARLRIATKAAHVAP